MSSQRFAAASLDFLPEGALSTYDDYRAEIIADVFMPEVIAGARCRVQIDHAPSLATTGIIRRSIRRRDQ